MKVFVTGGTGFIGWRLTERLVSEENDLVLLARSPELLAAGGLKRISVVRGDIRNKDQMAEGMKGCDLVFHLAAYARPWARDPGVVYDVNVTGTKNVLESAAECNVKRVVITSTAGIMTSSVSDKPADESDDHDPQSGTLYEKTKFEAERIALEFCKNGMEVVIVNPTRVYGPGRNSKSNSVTRLIRLYLRGLWRIIPGDGEATGNYVFIDDVVEGHILAALKGKSGERYILGGSNLSFNELFTIIGEHSGKMRRMIRIPRTLLRRTIAIMGFITRYTGIPPLITIDWFEKYMKNSNVSSEKAARELGYSITPAGEGISRTIRWLRMNK